MRPRTDSLLDTIAALATPAGRAALAIVRVSGGRTRQILSAVARGLPEGLRARRPYLTSLADVSGDPLDRGLVTFFAAPASATGEDVAEFSVHGSPIVIGRLLQTLVRAGARMARPGEFTERAFLLGKIDLLEAQAVADLIEARTETAARFSARRLEGSLSRRLVRLREQLLSAAAGLTATIDFAEDVGDALDQETLRLLSSAAQELARLSASYETGRLLSAGCRVAILGRPNVGKSTLFNALVGSARAIVTDVPGTTRDTLEATVDVAGVPVELVDTAGLRQTEDPVEKIGVARARQAGRDSDAVLYVFDAGTGWTPEDALAVSALGAKPIFLVGNKIDTLWAARPVFPAGTFCLCGLSEEAGQKLYEILKGGLALRLSTEVTSEVLSGLRERDLVDRARAAVCGTLESLGRGDSPEYAAAELEEALAALADLFGETTAEDVLAKVFSTFCIGK
ncbi:MAG TPA: tRNA uridine-5-carboxymethylaminomethyl(34) synthesis GTPase MnmE [Thermoanaerobaculia bacterium]|nr:tRNA uridine-5-carboxymethylaminomethyl(34) synthesis GTPase MnmE [Thermoanaerobaculia bacterium]